MSVYAKACVPEWCRCGACVCMRVVQEQRESMTSCRGLAATFPRALTNPRGKRHGVVQVAMCIVM